MWQAEQEDEAVCVAVDAVKTRHERVRDKVRENLVDVVRLH
jgi:hypothetical protein